MRRALYFLCLLLAACNIPLSPTATTEPPSANPTDTPSTGFQPCYYVWAYQDLPEISARVDEAVKSVVSDAEAGARAFGEDCVFEDGTRRFGAMETDFLIGVPVDDLADDEAIGQIIEKILPVFAEFPPGVVPGPNVGRAEFSFTHGSEIRYVRFSIKDGLQALAEGLRGAALLHKLEQK
ncbi:MAG: hypothetical protein AB1554_14115 [Chloroflexota bacterium]